MRKKFLVKQKYLLILKIKNKMKNLQDLNLVELNAQELKKTEGGWWGLALMAAELLWEAYTDPKDIKKGYHVAYGK